MTALDKYTRLESTAIWIESDKKPEKEVIVAFGKKTLIISDNNDNPFTHWSLTSTRIISRNENGVIFSPDPEGIEKLVVKDVEMINSMEIFISNTNSHKKNFYPLIVLIPTLAVLIFIGIYWKDLKIYFIPFISNAQEKQITRTAFEDHKKNYGPICNSVSGKKAIDELLVSLSKAYKNINILVLSNQTVDIIHFPSGTLMISKNFLNKTRNSYELVSILSQVNFEKTKRIPLKKVIEQNSLLDIVSLVIGLKSSLKIKSLNELEMISRRKTTNKEINLTDHSWVAIQNICFN